MPKMQRCHGAFLRIRLLVILLWWLPSGIIYSLISIRRSATDKALMPFAFHILDLILAVSKQLICQKIIAGFFNFYSSYTVSVFKSDRLPKILLSVSVFFIYISLKGCLILSVSNIALEFYFVVYFRIQQYRSILAVFSLFQTYSF